MTAEFWPAIEDQLAALNEQATAVLERTQAAPDGLPPAGSWIRAVTVDDDGHGKPASPWHRAEGWDGYIGTQSLRCRRRPGTSITRALENYLGGSPRPRRYRNAWDRMMLVVETERPAENACKQCDMRLARAAERATADERAAEVEALIELMPSIRTIASDTMIDDAERGRRLRSIWPS